MNALMKMMNLLLRRRAEPDPERARAMHRAAQEHYRLGNRLYDDRALDDALREWRQASGLWRMAQGVGRRMLRRFLHLRAALLFLATVGVVYMALFTVFPRDPLDLIMLNGGANSGRSWWESLLDSGRPQAGSGHKLGLREWWERFKRRFEGGEERRVAGRRGERPPIDERWEELLRRYGRWGPNFSSLLDYTLVSGYGLSRNGAYEEAVEVLKKGIQATEERDKLSDLYQGLANTHYYEGYRLQPDGLAKYDLDAVRKSTQAYEMSVGYRPGAVAYGNLGWMYFLVGEYDKAAAFSRQALEMDGGLEYVRLNLGLVYLKQDKVYDAFQVYRSVIRRNPPSDVYVGGINDLREIIRDAPGRHPFAHLMLGLLSVKKGDYGQAQRALERFLAAPYMANVWRDLAQDLLRNMPGEDLP